MIMHTPPSTPSTHVPIAAQPSAEPRAHRRFSELRNQRVDGALSLVRNSNGGFALPEAMAKLQEHTDTWMPGDLVIIPAYTGAGKTTLVQNIVVGWAELGHQILFFGTEQEPAGLTLKAGCLIAGVPVMDARRGRLRPKWKKMLEAAIEGQRVAPYDKITYYPSTSPTSREVMDAIRASGKNGVRIFVLDYLGRVDTSDMGKDAEWCRTKTFVKALKTMATELNVLVVCTAQLMKGENAAYAAHVKPEMVNIQGGQAVGQEADIVIGIFQPMRRGVPQASLMAVRNGEMEVSEVIEPMTAAVVVLKHREDGGRRGRIALFWVKHNRLTPRDPSELYLPTEIQRSRYEVENALDDDFEPGRGLFDS